jgi:hypothetical protein
MKVMRLVLVMMLLTGLVGLTTGCAIPRRIWPQTDIAPARAGSKDSPETVLLASRSSPFKEALIEKITKAATAENMAVDLVGIENLTAVRAENYEAAVIISTCLAWGVDPLVRKFLDRHPDYKPVVLVITSNSGWLPEKTDLDVDAMSSASVLDDSEAVARQIINRLHQMLE